jgi:CubicO group peptidase (beta-lactamase class C family)
VIRSTQRHDLPILTLSNADTSQGYGVAHLDGAPCTADTLFDCASTSKSFTAACVALLVDDEAYPDVQWRTPVSKLLDDFICPDPYLTANITIEDILSHRTGEPGHDDALFGTKAAEPDNAKSITLKMRNLPFNKPLRTEYQYSNLMFSVATHLIETVTCESYPDFVRKRIWEPLGMTNTYHDTPAVEAGNAKARMAMGYHWDKEIKEYFEIPSYAQPEGQGAGCVFSSVADYAKWVRALVQRSGPLSEDAHKEMVKGRTIVPFEGNDALPFYGHASYALGLIVESYCGHVVVGHDGSFDGFKAMMRFLPGNDWGVVVLGNSDDAFYIHQILLHQLMDDVLEVPQEARTDWPAYWRKCQTDEEKENEKEDPDLLPPASPEALDIPLEELAGTYFNAGYRNLVLTLREGRLEADCTDRGMPFTLKFDHLSRNFFIAEHRDLINRSRRKMKATFELREDGAVQRLGIPLCGEMEGEPIWFEKTR